MSEAKEHKENKPAEHKENKPAEHKENKPAEHKPSPSNKSTGSPASKLSIVVYLIIFVNLLLILFLISLSSKNSRVVARIDKIKTDLERLDELKKAQTDFFTQFEPKVVELIKANNKKIEDLSVSNREDITAIQDFNKKNTDNSKLLEEKFAKIEGEFDFIKKITQSTIIGSGGGGKSLDKAVVDKITSLNKKVDYLTIQLKVNDLIENLSDKKVFAERFDKFYDDYSGLFSEEAKNILVSISKEIKGFKDDKDIRKQVEDLYLSNLSKNKGSKVIKDDSYFSELIKIKDLNDKESYANDLKNKRIFEEVDFFIKVGNYLEARKKINDFIFTENESLFKEVSKTLEGKANVNRYLITLKETSEIDLFANKFSVKVKEAVK
jgi:hypothetical protein